MSKNVIGLMGYARSGKDTVANTLIEEFGYTRLAFADALRDAAYALNPFTGLTDPLLERLRGVVDHFGWDEAKQYPEVRRVLQVLGTEVGRDIISPTVWVDIAERRINKIIGLGGAVVITDVRFPNEHRLVELRGGHLWRVVRPGTEPVNGHASETALDTFGVSEHIINDGTLDDLAAIVRLIV